MLSQIFTIKIVMYLMLVRICSNKWQIISLVFSSLPKFPFLSLLLLNVFPLFLPNWLSSSSLSDSQYCFSSFFLFIKRLKTLQSLSFLIAPTFSRELISSVPCIYHINYAICLFLWVSSNFQSLEDEDVRTLRLLHLPILLSTLYK